MGNKKVNANGGVGFTGLLTIVFIVLKILGKISWSWIWVLSPLWINFIISVVVITIIILMKSYNKEKNMKKAESKES